MAAAVIVFLLCVLLVNSTSSQFSDLSGDYCYSRKGKSCCSGRNDNCAVPILDTLCYCDTFCDRTSNPDCCPDYWNSCKGLPLTVSPPVAKTCWHKGRSYGIGSVRKDNCNTCICREVGYHTVDFICSDKPCLVRPDLINAINTGDFGWKASNYSFLWGKTLAEGINQRLGTFPPSKSTMNMTEIRYQSQKYLPESFDSRVKWGKWLRPIRDQGDCAASWAFSSTALASDRLAIMSEGLWQVALSPQLLISCQGRGQNGCSGGHLDRAWWFLRKHGTSSERCYPYKSGKSRKSGSCKVKRWRVPESKIPRVLCLDGEEDIIYLSTPPYRTANKENIIMQEIYNNGPVQATFRVKEDFYSYRAGIYRHSQLLNNMPPSHRQEGWHSVLIIGWGVSTTIRGPVKYWLCANSWGSSWGEDGYFRILRGSNECDIESFVIGVWANLEEFEDIEAVGPFKNRGSRKRRKYNRKRE